MRGNFITALAGEHPARSLAVRGAAMRTFGSFAALLALAFLGLGAYIIRDELLNPLAAQSSGVFIAAVILAIAGILLYYVIQPRSRRRRVRGLRCVTPVAFPLRRIAPQSTNAVAPDFEPRRDLPFQRWYADPATIHMQSGSRNRREVALFKNTTMV